MGNAVLPSQKAGARAHHILSLRLLLLLLLPLRLLLLLLLPLRLLLLLPLLILIPCFQSKDKRSKENQNQPDPKHTNELQKTNSEQANNQ